MTKLTEQAISELVARVATWPPAERVTLARKILETVETPPEQRASRGKSAAEVIELLKAPPHAGQPADEVIDEMKQRYPRLFQHSDTAWVGSMIGLAAGEKRPPTDEEVEQWIHEHRMEKYGS